MKIIAGWFDTEMHLKDLAYMYPNDYAKFKREATLHLYSEANKQIDDEIPVKTGLVGAGTGLLIDRVAALSHPKTAIAVGAIAGLAAGIKHNKKKKQEIRDYNLTIKSPNLDSYLRQIYKENRG